jgi:hypothetical protein
MRSRKRRSAQGRRTRSNSFAVSGKAMSRRASNPSDPRANASAIVIIKEQFEILWKTPE